MKRIRSRRVRAALTSLAISLCTALIVILFTQEIFFDFPPLKRAELAMVDLRFQKRGNRIAGLDTSAVVIVAISQESFKSLPARWPWPKSYYTKLVRNLQKAGAKAIGVDIIFTTGDPANG